MDSDIDFKRTMEFAYGEPGPMGPGIVRLVADNASAFTFKGTNTYLVGMTSLAVIDPGPDDPKHIDGIQKCAAGRPITHIFITHAHRDHVDGCARLAAATGAVTCGFGRTGQAPAEATSPSGKAFVNYDFQPDLKLAHGDVVEGHDWALECVHTPGHAPDHLCFGLSGRGALFSGDHIMAWNTSVIAPPEGSMADYMSSLQRMLERNDSVYLPGHGGRIEEPQRVVKAYLLHRRWREQAIVAAIRNGADTINKIVPAVYPEISGPLSVAASLSVQAHVEFLMDRGVLASGPAATWDHPLTLA